jgi:hypothetical protein
LTPNFLSRKITSLLRRLSVCYKTCPELLVQLHPNSTGSIEPNWLCISSAFSGSMNLSKFWPFYNNYSSHPLVQWNVTGFSKTTTAISSKFWPVNDLCVSCYIIAAACSWLSSGDTWILNTLVLLILKQFSIWFVVCLYCGSAFEPGTWWFKVLTLLWLESYTYHVHRKAKWKKNMSTCTSILLSTY